MKVTVELVIDLHRRVVETSGGAHGIRDFNLIDSAVSSIYQTYDSKELYPTIIEKAARLCYALNKNHPFIDGNKRISMHILAVFLRIHNKTYKPTNDEVVRVGFSIADGTMSYESLVIWIKTMV